MDLAHTCKVVMFGALRINLIATVVLGLAAMMQVVNGEFCVEFCNGGPCQCFEPLASCSRDAGVCDSSGRCTGVCQITGLSIGLIVTLVVLIACAVAGCVFCCVRRARA
jgi:hypothetical protein